MREWLKIARTDAGMTMQNVADLCGIGRAYYSMIEKGQRNPSTKVAMLIGKVLKVKWVSFYTQSSTK